jgi:hypothetical protein
MEQNDTSSAIQKITRNLLPFLKLPAICPCTEPDNPCLRPPQTISTIPTLVIFSYRRLSLPSAFSFRISPQNILCISLLPHHMCQDVTLTLNLSVLKHYPALSKQHDYDVTIFTTLQFTAFIASRCINVKVKKKVKVTL